MHALHVSHIPWLKSIYPIKCQIPTQTLIVLATNHRHHMSHHLGIIISFGQKNVPLAQAMTDNKLFNTTVGQERLNGAINICRGWCGFL
jgi:hypothetical protein